MSEILQVLRETAEEAAAPAPIVTLKSNGRKWKDVLIDGVKAGYVTQHWINVATPLRGKRDARKMLLWTGEITHDGEKMSIGQTEKVSSLVPKIERLIRSYTIRKNSPPSETL